MRMRRLRLIGNSFHEKAGQSQDGFVFPFCGFLLFSRAASVAILPSAVFYERFSLNLLRLFPFISVRHISFIQFSKFVD